MKWWLDGALPTWPQSQGGPKELGWSVGRVCNCLRSGAVQKQGLVGCSWEEAGKGKILSF